MIPRPELAAANQLGESDSLQWRRGAGRSRSPCRCAFARASLHCPQGRHPGLHRGPLRRFAQPVATLEQPLRHPGCAGPQAPCRRARPHCQNQHEETSRFFREFLVARSPALVRQRGQPHRERRGQRSLRATTPEQSRARESTARIETLQHVHKNRRDPSLMLSFDSFCMQAIATITCASGEKIVCVAKMQIPETGSGEPLEALGWKKCSGCTQ